ncbi:hypothetical protein FSARC_13893 [Fusarium sarcochroum]|uniref:Uncharacterized protein n=1 Tax=Fusarium sarcochroum TaxID=1208366 RepID=A0A8H4SXZ3_9HYPO|nr:hypothetical protein FSARC_13893 [Fusarium sarcochroum]
MGILFSRPGRETAALPPGAFSAGNISSLDSSSISPYLGINTGLYDNPYPPIPLEWIVSPSTIDGSCPNGAQILTWFGVTEAVIAVLAPLFAYRPFVHWITRGRLGRRTKKRIALTWTTTFACQLLASAIVAGIMGNTPGYEFLNMRNIFTVLISRPRFYPIVVGILRCVVNTKRPKEWDKTTIIKRSIDDRVEFPYTDAWITTSLSEMLLLLISAIFTGVTWHRLPSDSKSREYASDHVSFVSSAPGLMFLCMLAFVPVYKRYGEAYPIEGRRYETGRQWGVTISSDGRTKIGVKKDTRKTAVKRGANAVCGALLLGSAVLPPEDDRVWGRVGGVHVGCSYKDIYAGALIYHIRCCLSDYSDANCIIKFSHLADAMARNSYLLIVEQVIESPPSPMATYYDIVMLMIGGKERTAMSLGISLRR